MHLVHRVTRKVTSRSCSCLGSCGFLIVSCMYVWMDGWMDEWVDGSVVKKEVSIVCFSLSSARHYY